MSSSKIIVVDAGHGGIDPGAVNGARSEKDDNLRLAPLVGKLLKRAGQTVIMTRDDDTYPSLQSRTDKANAAGADLYLSLHRNSYINATANGVEVWVHTDAGAIEEAVAGTILQRIVAVKVQSNRGVKKGDYHVLRETRMPAVLIELGFISNAVDNMLFDQNLNDYAKAIAQGACEALGVLFNPDDTQPTTGLYKVQVGAFAREDNARAFLEAVWSSGMDAYLVMPADGEANIKER